MINVYHVAFFKRRKSLELHVNNGKRNVKINKWKDSGHSRKLFDIHATSVSLQNCAGEK